MIRNDLSFPRRESHFWILCIYSRWRLNRWKLLLTAGGCKTHSLYSWFKSQLTDSLIERPVEITCAVQTANAVSEKLVSFSLKWNRNLGLFNHSFEPLSNRHKCRGNDFSVLADNFIVFFLQNLKNNFLIRCQHHRIEACLPWCDTILL